MFCLAADHAAYVHLSKVYSTSHTWMSTSTKFRDGKQPASDPLIFSCSNFTIYEATNA
jgi:hypothetical protein